MNKRRKSDDDTDLPTCVLKAPNSGKFYFERQVQGYRMRGPRGLFQEAIEDAEKAEEIIREYSGQTMKDKWLDYLTNRKTTQTLDQNGLVNLTQDECYESSSSPVHSFRSRVMNVGLTVREIRWNFEAGFIERGIKLRRIFRNMSEFLEESGDYNDNVVEYSGVSTSSEGYSFEIPQEWSMAGNRLPFFVRKIEEILKGHNGGTK